MSGDPWEDPHSEAERLQAERRILAGQLVARRVEFQRIQILWQNVIADTRTVDDCLALGAELHSKQGEAWIELSLLNLRCQHEASGITNPGLAALLRIAVLRLLLASCGQVRADVTAELEKTYATFSRAALSEAVESASDFLQSWLSGERYPATPHMTRQQLIGALTGIPGMSGPSISRAIRRGQMVADEPLGPMVRFRHTDKRKQLTILSACATFLKVR